MKTIHDARELMSKADSVTSGMVGSYVQYRAELNSKIQKIRNDRELSPTGIQNRVELLKRKERAILMKEAKEIRQTYLDYLSKARLIANDIYFAKVPAADEVKQERFEKQLATLKTEVLLSQPKQAVEKIKTFLAEIDEPSFFEQISGTFADLAAPVLNSAGDKADDYRHELSDMFDSARKSSLHPEALDAVNLLGYIDACENGRFFSMSVENAIETDFGHITKYYLNRPDDFFENYPDEKDLIPVKGLNTEAYILAKAEIEAAE